MDNKLPVLQLDSNLPVYQLDGQLPLLKLDKQISQGTAAERGFLESALGIARAGQKFFGSPGGEALATAQSTAQQQGEAAAQQHPITTGVAGLAPKVAAAIPTIPLGILAAEAGIPTAIGSTIVGAVGGAPVAGGDYETKYAEILRKTGDPELARKMALTAGLSTELGFALSGGIGSRLLPKIATGAGLNVGLGEAEVAVQNTIASEHPELQQKLFDPTRMGLNAALGGFAGIVGSTPGKAFTLSGIREELHNARQVKAQQMGKPMSAKETRLFHVENRSLEETNKLVYHERSLKKAEEAYATAVRNNAEDTETVKARVDLAQRSVDEARAVIKASEADYVNLSGTKYKTPAERFEAYVKEASEAGSTALLRRAEAFGSHYLKEDAVGVSEAVKTASVDLKSRAGLSGRLGPDERKSNAILDNIDFSSADNAHASIRSLIDAGEMSLDDIDKLITRNAALLEKVSGLDVKGKLRKALSKEQELLRTARQDISSGKKAPAITNQTWQTHTPTSNLTIRNATKAEADVVANMARTLGLSSEKFDIDLRGEGSRMGGSDAGFVGRISEHQASLLNPQNIDWFQRLNGADIARFNHAWHVGHELGHALMIRLFRNDIFTGDLDRLNKAYLKYLEDNPVAAKEGAMGTPLYAQRVAEVKAEEYSLRFAEYFAQRVAREVLNPSNTVIGSFVKNISKIWYNITKDMPLGSKHDNLVDSFIQDLIQKNRTSLDRTGKTIFEVTSVERSLADASKLVRKMSPVPPSYRPAYAQSPFESADKALGALGNKDINPTSGEVGKVLTAIRDVVPLLGKTELYDNPVISFLVTKIWNAYQKKTQMQQDILGGAFVPNKRLSFVSPTQRKMGETSFHILSEQATGRDFYEVSLVFQRGSGRLDYEANLRQNGTHLTDKQRNLYRATAKVFKDALDGLNAEQTKFGRALIPQKLGFVPSVRKGSFAAVVTSKTPITKGFTFDEVGNRVLDTTNTVHMEMFHTKQERDAWMARWEKLGIPDQTVGVLDRIPEVGVEHMELIRTMRDIAVLGGTDPATIARMDASLGDMLTTTGKVGGHHKRQMGFIKGGLGSGMFKDQNQQGLDFKASVVEYVGETSRIIERQNVELHANAVLLGLDPKTHGNLKIVIEGMRDYAIKGTERPFGKGSKEFIDAVTSSLINPVLNKFGKEWYPQQHVWDTVYGKINHAFYIKHLTSSLRFAVSQATVFGISIRSLVKTQGLLDAMADMSKGYSRLLGNDPEFFKFVEYAVEKSGSFHPSFIQDLTKHGFFENLDKRNKVMFNILSGESLSTSADSFSRLMTASSAFEHFVKQGYKGEDLYTQVLRLTDNNMILYAKTFKAPVFDKMGVIGEVLSPLSTYPLAQTVNLAADMRRIKNKREALGLYQASLPFLTTITMSAVLGGLRGTALLAEVELMIQAVNWGLRTFSDEEDPYQFPTLWDWYMGSPTGNKIVDTAISHGVVSAATLLASKEGVDLGSGNAWKAIVDTDKSWKGVVPVLGWFADVIIDTIKMAGTKYPTTGQREDLIKQVAPQWLSGLISAAFFDSYGPGVQQTKSGDAKLNKSPERAIAKIMGAKTIDEQKESARQFRYKQLTMQKRRESRAILQQISTGRMPQEEAVKQLRILAKDYHMSIEDITSSLKDMATKSSISTETMPMGKGFSMPTNQEAILYQQVYGKNK